MCVCVCVLYTHCKQILNYESLERLMYAISTGLWEWAIPIVTETPLVVGCKKKKMFSLSGLSKLQCEVNTLMKYVKKKKSRFAVNLIKSKYVPYNNVIYLL